jgi:hypothetical protein
MSDIDSLLDIYRSKGPVICECSMPLTNLVWNVLRKQSIEIPLYKNKQRKIFDRRDRFIEKSRWFLDIFSRPYTLCRYAIELRFYFYNRAKSTWNGFNICLAISHRSQSNIRGEQI